MKKSYIAASVIAALAILYFVFHAVFAGSAPVETTSQDIASKKEAAPQAFKIIGLDLQASMRPGVLVLRGKTEASRQVSVRAETAGAVAQTPTREGALVKKGDVLCRLSIQARQAKLDQARANRDARKLEWVAARTLEKKGHRSATQTAVAKAAYDAALAGIRQAEIELANINIRAPFDGVFERRNAEVGDYLAPGQSCGIVAELDPLIVSANVSEKDIARISVGLKGRARMASGQRFTGTVRYIDPIADGATRTFRIELQADNSKGELRAGMTADLRLDGPPVSVQLIPADTMVLDSAGQLGVRTVDETSHVRFFPITIIEDGKNGIWVAGLPEHITLIIEGQDFVRAGSLVDLARAS